MSMKSKNHLLGDSAEHLVCADLMQKGIEAFILSGFDYDIFLPEKNKRVQVKSANKLNNRYQFAQGGHLNRKYKNIDYYALVFWGKSIRDTHVVYKKTHKVFSFKEIPKTKCQI